MKVQFYISLLAGFIVIYCPCAFSAASPLEASIREGNKEETKRILDSKEENVNPGVFIAFKPLYCAVECENEEICELLLQYGADPHPRTSLLGSPLALAIKKIFLPFALC